MVMLSFTLDKNNKLLKVEKSKERTNNGNKKGT